MNDLHVVHATDKFAEQPEPGFGIETPVVCFTRIEGSVDILGRKRIGYKFAQIP